jgi:hypothetical protein
VRAIKIGARENSAGFHSEARNLTAPSLALVFAVFAASRLNAKGPLLLWNDSPAWCRSRSYVDAVSLRTKPTIKVSQQKEKQI